MVAMLAGDPGKKLERASRLTQPVISVGGLSFGGAGKTPLVISVLDLLNQRGQKSCVLTRGYRGKSENPLVVSEGTGPIATVQEAGDEAVMLSQKSPQSIVVKDSNRHRGGLLAESRYQVDVHVLDDGFQHRALQRDLNILSLHADSVVNPRSPSQLLREPLRYAALADLFVIQASSPKRTQVTVDLLKADFPGIPIVEAEFRLNRFTSATGEHVTREEVSQKRFLALAGIATPGRFLASLRSAGLTVADAMLFYDHYQFSTADVEQVSHRLKQLEADAIITTEKDIVRLRPLLDSLPKQVLIAGGNLEYRDNKPLVNAIDRVIANA